MRTITSKVFSPAIRIVVLMIITTGIAYPLLVTAIGQTAMPSQSNGSPVILNGKVVGSELISQSFTSAKFFQPRNDSASGVDPDITPDSAVSQIPAISGATGIPVNALKTLVDLDVARNKETNALVFTPDYVNVLNINVELVKQYPDVYAQEVSAKEVP
ncbi:Potassium-transporting ATPase C chain [Nitrosotalea devaniterrae]|uniref:Potassium-transporting ATPase C chain n=1 Tax=Nitrosotalea devaniterrae TaxID=1078905 RepID=A0A128A4D9_9ARCH|nr:Potassium-transporting ATPase C chain [Candidatus Nitrosotalea devanaterra]